MNLIERVTLLETNQQSQSEALEKLESIFGYEKNNLKVELKDIIAEIKLDH